MGLDGGNGLDGDEGLDGEGFEGLDDEPRRPWLPPDDRLWRHPSEISLSNPPPRGARHWPLVVLAGAVGVILVTGLVVTTRAHPSDGITAGNEHAATSASRGVGTTLAYHSTSPASPPASTASLHASPSFMDGVSRVFPSVVGIQVTSAGRSGRGSGLLLNSDGMVLTTQRLVAGASRITVVTSDDRSSPATIVGTDPDTDVAVVRFPAQGMTAASFSQDQSLVPGQMVVAVSAGQPGQKPAVSIGTIQAMDRPVDLPSGPPLLDVIETDAPLSSDTEGAALVGRDGQVIGMAAVSPSPGPASTPGGQAHWLATPGTLAWKTAQQLMATGHVVRAWLGIEGSDAGPARPGSTQRSGAKVTSVQPGSPAAAAGLQIGDIIQAVDGHPVPSMLDLRAALRLSKPGDKVTLSVLQGSKVMVLPAILASQ